MGGEFQHKWGAWSLAYLNDAYGDRMIMKNALECEIYAGCLFHCQQGLERDTSRQKPVLVARDALVAHTAGLVQEMTAVRELSALVKRGLIE
ncbi:MAG: hypothetical protein C5S48_10285 [Candidatus Methanogaster sp.]|nr:MAG: hypothetical protein C5S48_10285 [ANME-2 cluster archaeon]